MRALREFCSGFSQVPTDVVGDRGGSVSARLFGGGLEAVPEVLGDASESADWVLVDVGHGTSMPGWLTTRQVLCNTWVVNHPGTAEMRPVSVDDKALDIIVDTVPMVDITAAVKAADPEWEVITLIEKAVAATIADRDLTIARLRLSLDLSTEILREDLADARKVRAALWETLKRMARRNGGVR